MSKSPQVPAVSPVNSTVRASALPSLNVEDCVERNNAYKTPPGSPPQSNPQTPVIVQNPLAASTLHLPGSTLHIPPPTLPPNPSRRLPDPSGKWDSYPHIPSYFRGNSNFWLSRQCKIPVTRTVSSPLLSELGFSPLSHVSSEAFESEAETVIGATEPLAVNIEKTLTIGGIVQHPVIMPSEIDPLLSEELGRLQDIKDEVILSIAEDIPVSRVTQCNA